MWPSMTIDVILHNVKILVFMMLALVESLMNIAKISELRSPVVFFVDVEELSSLKYR